MDYPTQTKVLVKVDWNVPDLEHTERIETTLPTLETLLKKKNTVIVATHWGRPNGKVDPELSTEKMIPVLGKLLKSSKIEADIIFVDQVTNFEAARNTIKSCGVGKKAQIILLENTRFIADEQAKMSKKRAAVAKQYAELAEFMVDEAFSLSHRHEATNTEIKLLLPHSFGTQYTEEVEELSDLKNTAEKPFILVMGGSKLETKLPLIEKLLPKVDRLFIGGQLVFTFMAARGDWAYDSAVEESFVPRARKLLEKYKDKIVLANVEYTVIDGKKVGVDVGVEFIHKISIECRSRGTVFWNGCMGWIEKGYTTGNQSMAYTLATSGAYVVVGGGDTVASIREDVLAAIDFVSMGGGATLEYLAS